MCFRQIRRALFLLVDNAFDLFFARLPGLLFLINNDVFVLSPWTIFQNSPNFAGFFSLSSWIFDCQYCFLELFLVISVTNSWYSRWIIICQVFGGIQIDYYSVWMSVIIWPASRCTFICCDYFMRELPILSWTSFAIQVSKNVNSLYRTQKTEDYKKKHLFVHPCIHLEPIFFTN